MNTRIDHEFHNIARKDCLIMKWLFHWNNYPMDRWLYWSIYLDKRFSNNRTESWLKRKRLCEQISWEKKWSDDETSFGFFFVFYVNIERNMKKKQQIFSFETTSSCHDPVWLVMISNPTSRRRRISFVIFFFSGYYTLRTKFKTNADVYFHSLSHITLQAKENEETKTKRVIQFSDDLLRHPYSRKKKPSLSLSTVLFYNNNYQERHFWHDHYSKENSVQLDICIQS